jgi:DNA-binding NarL/FixJ family response regulator
MPEKTIPASAPSAKKRVLIVDDHPVFRAGLTGLVNLEDDLIVCGEAHDAAQAMHLLEELRPDVMLMDMSLPGKNGLEVLKDIGTLSPQTLVLIISMHDETLFAERVIRAGGRG